MPFKKKAVSLLKEKNTEASRTWRYIKATFQISMQAIWLTNQTLRYAKPRVHPTGTLWPIGHVRLIFSKLKA